MNRLFAIASLLLLLFSCKREESNEINLLKFNLEGEDEIKTLSPDSIFASVRYVKLETTGKSIIQEIDKVTFDDQYIYIFDYAQKSVLLYSLDGQYIKSLDKIGGAEEEYLSLNDFYVEDNLLYTLCRDNKSIKVYNIPELAFIESIKLDDFYSKFAFTDDNIYLYADFSLDNLNNITVINRNTNKPIIQYKSFPEKRLGEGFRGNVFSIYNDTVYCTFPYECSLYKLNEAGYEQLIAIDFGKSNMLPPDLNKSPMSEINEYRRKLPIDKWPIIGVNGFFRTKSKYFFSFIYKSLNYSTIYDIRDSTYKYGYIFQTPSFPLVTPELKYYKHNQMIQVIKSNWIPSTLNTKFGVNIPEFLHSIEEDDNPLIGFYELRKEYR